MYSEYVVGPLTLELDSAWEGKALKRVLGSWLGLGVGVYTGSHSAERGYLAWSS